MLTRRRVLPALILVLALVVACGGPSGPDQSRAQPTATPAVALGPAVRVEAGGYSYRPPADYEHEVYEMNARIGPPGADAQLGPVMVLSGGQNAVDLYQGATTLPEAFAVAQSSLGESGVTLSAPTEITVGGQPALIGSVSGTENSTPMTGRVAVCLPAAGQAFILVASSPEAAWDAGFGLAFEAVLGSIEFFPPVVP